MFIELPKPELISDYEPYLNLDYKSDEDEEESKNLFIL